jgi:1-acyl-sn-glycerol-3-phosphate acyltransferase
LDGDPGPIAWQDLRTMQNATDPGQEPDPGQVSDRWHAPLLWRATQRLARTIIPLFCRLRITGDVPADLKQGPLILAGNHIANCDPMIMTVATARRHISPRMMATGGLFRAPVIGKLMAAAGHIPVDRGHETIVNAILHAAAALEQGSVIFIYPEGRIGLDPAMWPERPKTGMARLALHTGVPVVPVAIWGSHAVVAYHGRSAMIRTAIRSLWRRPVVRVHFGHMVDMSGLREGAVGHAQKASDRVTEALIAALALLRPDEPRLPRFRDPTRPLSTARVYKRGRLVELRQRGGTRRIGRS